MAGVWLVKHALSHSGGLPECRVWVWCVVCVNGWGCECRNTECKKCTVKKNIFFFLFGIGTPQARQTITITPQTDKQATTQANTQSNHAKQAMQREKISRDSRKIHTKHANTQERSTFDTNRHAYDTSIHLRTCGRYSNTREGGEECEREQEIWSENDQWIKNNRRIKKKLIHRRASDARFLN